MSAHAERQILGCVRSVMADERHFGVLSTGEKIAVALVLEKPEWLKRAGWPNVLEAVDRLGHEWLDAAVRVQRAIQ